MQTMISTLKGRLVGNRELQRFARFLAVGLSGTAIDFVILTLLKLAFGWATLPANFVSYSCGIVNNYLLSRYWVYPESRQQQGYSQLIKFVVISLIGLALNNLLVLGFESLAHRYLDDPQLSYLPAKIVAILVVLLWNFFANRLWTFSRPQPQLT